MSKDHEKISPVYVLQLYITGASPNSTRAVSNIKKICEQYLKGKYSLEIIDVYQQTAIAQSQQLLALPLLIKHALYLKKN